MSIIREIPKLNPSLEHFLEHTRHKTYDARSMIIHEGDVSKCLYYIIESSVSALAENESGDEMLRAAHPADEVRQNLNTRRNNTSTCRSDFSRELMPQISYIAKALRAQRLPRFGRCDISCE